MCWQHDTFELHIPNRRRPLADLRPLRTTSELNTLSVFVRPTNLRIKNSSFFDRVKVDPCCSITCLSLCVADRHRKTGIIAKLKEVDYVGCVLVVTISRYNLPINGKQRASAGGKSLNALWVNGTEPTTSRPPQCHCSLLVSPLYQSSSFTSSR
jgi:hypothetical protein